MNDEKKKSNKKTVIIGSLVTLLLVVAAAVTYKLVFVEPEGDTDKEAYADNRDGVKPIEVATPTPVEEEPYIMSVEEVLNSKPVVTEVSPTPDVETNQDEDLQRIAEEQDAVIVEDDKDNGTVQDTSAPDASEDEDSKPAKKKKVVIDESTTTVKEKNVKEYEGGEKTGSGNSFMDQMPEQEPVDGDVNGDIPASGIAVGTWN